MEGFRIVCDLSALLDGIRKRSFLYVDVAKLYTISDLCMQIRASFNIKKSVALMIDDVFLPFVENIKILRADDVVKVVLVDAGKSSSYRNGNGLPQTTEEVIQDSGVPTENVHVQEISPILRQRKRKKNTSNCEIGDDNDTQLLPQMISDVADAVGLESLLSKKKKKRKQRKPRTKLDEESIDQGLTDSIPEAIPCKTEPSSVEFAAGETIAENPSGEPEANLPSKKRRRIRIRKKKTVTSDMTPEMKTQQNCNDEVALNPYAIGACVDSNASHIRFSSRISNEGKNELLDYNPLEDDLVMHHGDLVETDNSTEKNNSEINEISKCLPTIIAPGSVAPLVVRRAKVEPLQHAQVAKARNFLQNPPEINDIITFKIWKMGQDYCPQISGIIKAKVLNFFSDSKQVRFFILDGKNHCEQPSGKFSLNEDFTEDGPSEPPTIPDIMELNWEEMLEVEIFL